MSTRPATRIAGWAAAGVLVAGIAGAGIAHAADPTPTATPSPGASTAPGAPGGADRPGAGHERRARGPAARRALPGLGALAGRRLMHGEMVVAGRNGTPTTVDVQRGTVTAVSASSIRVRSGDGFTATYRIDSTTTVRLGTTGATAAQIHTGDTATVTARKDGDTSTATLVAARDRTR